MLSVAKYFFLHFICIFICMRWKRPMNFVLRNCTKFCSNHIVLICSVIWHIYLLSEYDEIGWNASCPFSVVVGITQIDATRERIFIIIFIVIWVISFHKLNSANSWVIWFLIWMRINWKFSAYVFHVMNVIQGISLLLLFERCSIHDWFDTLWIKHKWNNKLQCIPIFNCSI